MLPLRRRRPFALADFVLQCIKLQSKCSLTKSACVLSVALNGHHTHNHERTLSKTLSLLASSDLASKRDVLLSLLPAATACSGNRHRHGTTKTHIATNTEGTVTNIPHDPYNTLHCCSEQQRQLSVAVVVVFMCAPRVLSRRLPSHFPAPAAHTPFTWQAAWFSFRERSERVCVSNTQWSAAFHSIL